MSKGTIISAFASFAVGVSVGWFVSSRLLKHRYEQKAEEEIAKVREFYVDKEKKVETAKKAKEAKADYKGESTDTPDPKVSSSFDMSNYKETVASNVKKNYSEYFAKDQKITTIEDDPKERSGPYMISPDDFGERADDDYDCETYYFYKDGTVADADNNIIDNYTKIVGTECLNNFGYYPEEPYSVFVRNDKLKLDVEIINLPDKTWADVVEQNPYLA